MRYRTKKAIIYITAAILTAMAVGIHVGYKAGAQEAFEHAAYCEQQGGAPYMIGSNVRCIY